MKTIAVVGLVVLLATSSLANAMSHGSNVDGPAVKHVNITFNRVVMDANQVSQIRKEIYKAAIEECDALSESFSADCKLTSLAVSEYSQVAGATILSLTASAAYELSSKTVDTGSNATQDKGTAN